MRWTTRMWWVAAGLLPAAACGRGDAVEPGRNDRPASVEIAVDQPFTLRIGQSATVPGTGITITFSAVSEDSRCPTDVTCVWAGNARLELTTRDGSAERSLAINTTTEPRAVTIGTFRLELLELKPTPVSETTIPAAEYRATLELTGG